MTNQQTVDMQDRNEVMMAWYPMVQRIAHRASATYGLPQGVDTADLVSCGVLGLAEAWERYDPERGVAFEAFAVPRVKGAIVDAIRASDWVPRKARQKARLTGEPLTLLVSIDEQRPSEDGDRSTAERLADDSAPQPGADVVEAEDRRELMGCMNRLPERERMIVTLHYFQGVQLAEIARSLGVTESRVSQLHTRALRLMRETIATSSEPSAPSAA
jgi:RNA polymerase sigma factor for flagellar operon FliA